MNEAINFRLWVCGLVLVLLQYLISDEGKRSVSAAWWYILLTAGAVASILLVWPYVKDNTLRVLSGDAYAWPIAVLVATGIAIAASTWLVTYSHMSAELATVLETTSGTMEQSEQIQSLQQKLVDYAAQVARLQKQLSDAEKRAEEAEKLAADRLETATGLEHSLKELRDKQEIKDNAHRSSLQRLGEEKESLQQQVSQLQEAMKKKVDAAEQAREAKSHLFKKADSAPTYNDFTQENGSAWMQSAKALVQRVASGQAYYFITYGENAPTFAQLQSSVESLRAIAINLKPDDLV